MSWFKVPPKIYFKRGALDLALKVLKDKKRAFIVTDAYLFNSGAVNKITKILSEMDIEYQIFFGVKPDPTISMVNQALSQMRPFEPDLIIALGGGSPMDAAKVMWLLYEQPNVKLEDISMKNMSIDSRVCKIPDLGQKAYMVCIPTTSGTGSEVTPLSIITDDKTQIKYELADYALTPNMAIVDPNFVDSMPPGLTAVSGTDALVHAIEAYVSSISTNFTNSSALEGIKLIFRYLERSYKYGANDPLAREKMHYAANISGQSFSNAFFGLCQTMAHRLGTMYHLPYGLANAMLIRQIIKYNTSDKPTKDLLPTQYQCSNAKVKYCQIADELGLGGNNEDEKIERLIAAIEGLMLSIKLPLAIKDFGIDKQKYIDNLDELLDIKNSDLNKDLINDLKQIYIDAYNGVL